jgi:hypothetical protein
VASIVCDEGLEDFMVINTTPKDSVLAFKACLVGFGPEGSLDKFELLHWAIGDSRVAAYSSLLKVVEDVFGSMSGADSAECARGVFKRGLRRCRGSRMRLGERNASVESALESGAV